MSNVASAARFCTVTEVLLKEILAGFVAGDFEGAKIVAASQGVNNNTYLIGVPEGGGVAVKLRPASGRDAPADSPYWPEFTRVIWGATPNGDIRTLEAVALVLQVHGALRIPRILRVDHSLDRIAAPYVITELLAGASFDWDANTIGETAAADLGGHLGRLHERSRVQGFGIFDSTLNGAGEWWPRFTIACAMLFRLLANASKRLEDCWPAVAAALERAVDSGDPEHFALVCLDQAPTHYLRGQDGGIAAMVDIEGHLWAPVEYELAIVSLWMNPMDRFQAAYGEHSCWPGNFEEVKDVYRLFTWMQWMYCMRYLTPNEATVASLERTFMQMCGIERLSDL